jgi:steroid 5-alpha reductase family enzyme
MLLVCAAAFLVASVFWLFSLVRRDAGVADIAWGLLFVAIAWASFVGGDQRTPMLLAALLTSLWGLRLALHIGRRNLGEAEEDRRYARMRRKRPGIFWLWSYPMVFLLQGVLALLVAMPLYSLGFADQESVGLLSWLGVAVFAIGLAFEAIGDAQLTRFRRDPSTKGQVMDRGLWRYTRHPNYFGDATVWWGLWLVAVGSGAAWWTFVGPLLMSYLIVRVSGVKMLEADMAERRPAYREYMERTSAFFPLPPRKAD